MKQTMIVVIEIESNNTHSVKNIEQALNFYWGSNGKFTVREAVEQPRATDLPGSVEKLDDQKESAGG